MVDTNELVKGAAKGVLFGRTAQYNHLISGLVMAGGFLVGFLPLYTGFLERLGGYDRQFAVVTDRLDRDEKDIFSIQASVTKGNDDTRARLDQLIDSLHKIELAVAASKGAK